MDKDHVHRRAGVHNKFFFLGLRVDAGRHLFSESEKNVVLFYSLLLLFHHLLWSPCCSYCPSTSSSKMWWTNAPAYFRWEPLTPWPRTSLPQKKDGFFRGRQIAYLIYEYFLVTGNNDSVENYADLLILDFRNEWYSGFDSKWDGVLLSMTNITFDDILEWLYQQEYESLSNSRPYWNCTNWRFIKKKSWTWWSQIVDNCEKKYRAESTKQEFWRQKQKLWKKRCGQESGDTKAWLKNPRRLLVVEKPTGSVLKETIAVSGPILISGQNRHSRIPLKDFLRGRMWETHREPEVLETDTQVEECLDCPARITSKELATNSLCQKWHPPECLFYKIKSGCRFGEVCFYAHRQVDEQPSNSISTELSWGPYCRKGWQFTATFLFGTQFYSYASSHEDSRSKSSSG